MDNRIYTLYAVLAFTFLGVIYGLYVGIDTIRDMLNEPEEYINQTTGEVEFSLAGVIDATVFNLIHYHFLSLRWKRTE